jgi:hypothetical protein
MANLSKSSDEFEFDKEELGECLMNMKLDYGWSNFDIVTFVVDFLADRDPI